MRVPMRLGEGNPITCPEYAKLANRICEVSRMEMPPLSVDQMSAVKKTCSTSTAMVKVYG